MTLIEKIKYLKETIGFNTTKASKGAGINTSTLNKFINGERNISEENAEKINKYINDTLAALK